ncbi:MAG: type I restriction enzyme HsdR N-terminal domain-containing protein, partial [Flavobacteriales bacterium]
MKLTKKGEKLHVWCIVRKKTLILTPEEWVRQHLIHYLLNERNVPIGLIAAEMSLKVNEMDRR